MSAVLTMTAAVQAAGELRRYRRRRRRARSALGGARGRASCRACLWVRPGCVLDGLKAADWVLDAGGFGLVVLYVAGGPMTNERRFARPHAVAQPGSRDGKDSWRTGRQIGVIGEAPWIRLARRAERARSALLVVGDRPIVGTVAVLSLAAERGRVRWLGGERGAPRLLDGVRGRIAVARSKLGPPAATAEVPLEVAPGHGAARR